MATTTSPQVIKTTSPVAPTYLRHTTRCGFDVARYTDGSFIIEWGKSRIVGNGVDYYHVTASADEAVQVLADVMRGTCPCPGACAAYEVWRAIDEAGVLA